MGLKEVALLVALASVLAVAMTWPTARHLRTRVPENLINVDDVWDPLVLAWEVAWDGHALTHQPAHFFDSNTFWPLKGSLAFGDALIGYAPAGLVGSGVGAALARHNLLVIFSFAAAFVGAYLLARELDLDPAASSVAGAAFAFAPWRLPHVIHLHVISSAGIPLALFLLVRGWRRRRPGLLFAGWAVATWQLSLGFTHGLPLAYLLFGLSAVTAIRWLRHGRPPVTAGVTVAAVGGMALFLAWGALQALPYLRVQRAYPEQAVRPVEMVKHFSPPPVGFLAAPEESVLWSGVTRSARQKVDATEQALFPGVVVVLLGLFGLFRSTRVSRRLRAGLAVAVVVSAVLAMGFRVFGGWLGYRYLYEYVPGWKASRTPGRLVTFTTLALALLAATGAQHVVDRIRSARADDDRFGRLVAPAVGALAAVLVLMEGLGTWPSAEVPRPPAALAQVQDPVLLLPTNPAIEGLYMYWSTDGFRRIANGQNSVVPEPYEELKRSVGNFPNDESVDFLMRLGIRTVLVWTPRAAGTPWEDAATRAVDDLPVRVETVGDTVVFHLLPRGQNTGP